MPLNQQASAEIADPYPGPRPFWLEESPLFKGREKESRDLRDLILSYQVVVLHSHSGAGKTSLINAGLLPLLLDEGYESFPPARVGGAPPPNVDLSRINNIFAFNALSSCLGPKADPTELLQMDFHQFLMNELSGKPNPRLLIFDQFEELFTNQLDHWEKRRPFFLQLHDACSAHKLVHMLFVIREDYLAELDPYAELLPYGLRIRYRLERLRENAALDAVTQPLESVGYEFGKGVAESLVANLRKTNVWTPDGIKEIVGEYVEPMHLQIACERIWKNRPVETKVITSKHVQQFADVDQALASFYDEAVAVAAKGARLRDYKVRGWFQRKLITPDGTRGLVYRGKQSTAGVPNEAVDILEQEHLVRADSRTGARWYELTHDRFIAPILKSNRARRTKRRRYQVGLTALALLALVISFVWAYTRHARYQAEARHGQEDNQERERAASEESEATGRRDNKDWQGSLNNYQNALELYTKLNDKPRMAEVLRGMGFIYHRMYQFERSLSYYTKAKDLHEQLVRKAEDSNEQLGSKAAVAQDALDIGIQCDYLGRMDDTIKSYDEAQRLYAELGQDFNCQRASALNPLAASYITKGDLDDGVKYIGEGLRMSEACPSSSRQLAKDKLLLLRSIIYATRGDYWKALDTGQGLLNSFDEEGDTEDAETVAENMGIDYFYLGDLPKAMYFFQDALRRAKVLVDSDAEGWVCLRFVRLYAARHEYEQALANADRALKIGGNYHSRQLITGAHAFTARTYLSMGRLADSRKQAQQSLALSQAATDRWYQAYNWETLGLVLTQE